MNTETLRVDLDPGLFLRVSPVCYYAIGIVGSMLTMAVFAWFGIVIAKMLAGIHSPGQEVFYSVLKISSGLLLESMDLNYYLYLTMNLRRCIKGEIIWKGTFSKLNNAPKKSASFTWWSERWSLKQLGSISPQADIFV